MKFIELAKKRFSVRSFQEKAVEEEKLLEMLEAARVAPTAVNFQPWIIIVVRDAGLKKEITSCYRRDWITGAPVILVVCADHGASWKRADGKDHADIDAAIVVDHLTLAAADLGLGTCWVCNFDAEECLKLLDLPSNFEPVALLPVGYPAIEADPGRHDAKRKKLEDVAFWDGYGQVRNTAH